MNVLVTGASGFIGSALVERLVASGIHVVALTRRTDRTFAPQVERRIGDLATGAGITPDLLNGISVVFHCAGEIGDPSRMHAVHVDGTRRLLDGAVERGSIHWVQLSSVGAYGPPPAPAAPRIVTETTPENPRGPYEISKTAADMLVRSAPRDRVTWTILRPSNVIGARMPNQSLRGLLSALRRGRYFHIGSPGAIATYVHVDDVAAALLECARQPQAHGEIFNLSSDCPLDAVLARAAQTMRATPPRWRVPESIVRLAVRTLSPVMSLPLTQPRIDALVARTSYPADKMQSMLSFHFTRPLPDAVDDVVASLG